MTVKTEDSNHRCDIVANNDRLTFLNLVFRDSPEIMKRKFLGYEKIVMQKFRKYTVRDDLFEDGKRICADIRLKFGHLL